MIVLVVMLFFIVIFLLLPIKIEFLFSKELDLNIKILGKTLFSLKDNNKEHEVQKENTDSTEEIKDGKTPESILKVVKLYFEVITDILKILHRYLKRRLKIKKFNFYISFGLGDAAMTGIFSGGVYTVINIFYAYLLNTFPVKQHNVKIEPDFNNERFDIGFELNFYISLFWVICLLFYERKAIDKLLKIIKKDGVSNG